MAKITKSEIYSKEWYQIKYYSLSQGAWCHVGLDSSQVWEIAKAYNELPERGSWKRDCPTLWDFIASICSYNM